MTLQQINYILTIAEFQSMNKAAAELFIAQPTLTGTVKEVEKEIGIPIFHRTHKGVFPTAEGEDFLIRIKKIYQEYENVIEHYSVTAEYRRKFAVSMQHYSFAVRAFVETAKQYNANKFELVIRETKTADVIDDVSKMRSEIGLLYISDTNQRMIKRLLRENELEFTALIDCSASVFLAKSHPLASEKELTFKQLAPYPCLSFEQGVGNELYFAEEILIEHVAQKTIKATDRATMMNLMSELNGYTLCSNIFSEELTKNEYIVIPFKASDNESPSMTIGYITKKNFELSDMGRQFLAEIDKELNG